MIYFDTSYLARLYFEDSGWEKVRQLTEANHLACCIHGRAEVMSAIHRKFREGIFTVIEFRQVLEQFELDCNRGAYHWLPLSTAVTACLKRTYEVLPKMVSMRAADAMHLACAAENGFREIHSNDRNLLAAATHFRLRGINII